MIALRFIIAVGLILIAIGCGEPDPKKAENENNYSRELNMDLDKLRDMVLDENWEALDLAEEIGSEAVPVLTELLKNKDSEIRKIALSSVDLTGDEAVPKITASMLGDINDDVRSTAIQNLKSNYNETVEGDLLLNIDNDDPKIRSVVPLLLANLGKDYYRNSMTARLEKETDDEVIHALWLALSKLGETEYKRKIAAKMDIPDAAIRYTTIGDLEYIGDKRFVNHLLPALDDKSPAYNVGSKDHPAMARVCDAAVNLIAQWYPNAFSFEINPFKVYEDDEVSQAIEYLKGIER